MLLRQKNTAVACRDWSTCDHLYDEVVSLFWAFWYGGSAPLCRESMCWGWILRLLKSHRCVISKHIPAQVLPANCVCCRMNLASLRAMTGTVEKRKSSKWAGTDIIIVSYFTFLSAAHRFAALRDAGYYETHENCTTEACKNKNSRRRTGTDLQQLYRQ